MTSASTFPRIGGTGQLASRRDVLSRPSVVPSSPGVYAWYFSRVPPGIDTTECHVVGGQTLLYVGISPKEPPTNGRPPSRSTLRQRLRTHYAGNAAGSTLRKTLGCLLTSELGYPLRRVGSGDRLTFTNPGEQALDSWLEANAFVTWVVSDRPWEVERQVLLSGIPLPLNIRDNPCAAHTEHLGGVRRRAVAAALALPVVADNGGARRLPVLR
ncbi:MAG: GIY-YIG nuclease family protein [Phenylobacterium sp.]